MIGGATSFPLEIIPHPAPSMERVFAFDAIKLARLNDGGNSISRPILGPALRTLKDIVVVCFVHRRLRCGFFQPKRAQNSFIPEHFRTQGEAWTTLCRFC